MMKRSMAALELLLVLPAALFMTSLFLRQVQPTQFEPAHTAQFIVEWFAARPAMGLHICLIAMPLAAMALGCATLFRAWQSDAELRSGARATVAFVRAYLALSLVALAALGAAGILAIVALHVITD